MAVAVEWLWFESRMGADHRKRIKTEEKAKVIAASWGTECFQFLAVLAILHQDELKNRVKTAYFSTCPGAK